MKKLYFIFRSSVWLRKMRGHVVLVYGDDAGLLDFPWARVAMVTWGQNTDERLRLMPSPDALYMCASAFVRNIQNNISLSLPAELF